MSAQTYSEWVGEIYDSVENLIEVTRSDAQGIVDAQAFTLAQQWALGALPIDAAAAIIKASQR